MNRSQVVTNARHAGTLRRYHTWPMLREQTVGEHSWQCMRIWHQIWGPMPPAVSSYFLWHDAGELVTGDLPFPIKSENPGLRFVLTRLENDAVKAMGGEDIYLDEKNKIRAKACDLIEMHEHGLMEMMMGNRFGEPIVKDTHVHLKELPLSLEDKTKISVYLVDMEAKCKSLKPETSTTHSSKV